MRRSASVGSCSDEALHFRVADVQANLVKARGIAAISPVSLPEFPTRYQPCNMGPSLRANMGLAMLDIAPRERATRSLIQGLDADVDTCAAYAATVLAWLGPGIGKDALTSLVHIARCKDELVSRAAAETLALIGTEDSAVQLQGSMSLVGYCAPDDHDWFNLDVATLAFRIRERLAKQ
jgi:hypothetical protein